MKGCRVLSVEQNYYEILSVRRIIGNALVAIWKQQRMITKDKFR
jgi:hypothetical protein